MFNFSKDKVRFKPTVINPCLISVHFHPTQDRRLTGQILSSFKC